MTLSRMRPNVLEVIKLVELIGKSNEGVFVRLLMSARNSRFLLSLKKKRLRSVMSMLKNLGPRKKFRPVLPCSPGAGVEKSARCAAEKMKLVPDSWITSPISAVQLLQFAVDCTALLTVNAPEKTGNGRPLCQTTASAISQPPTSWLMMPGASLRNFLCRPNGNS